MQTSKGRIFRPLGAFCPTLT